MCDALRERILAEGRVSGDLVLVDGFLNHRIDTALMAEIGRWLAAAVGDDAPDVVVTSEASGIAPAYAVAAALGSPLVFAKKRHDPAPGLLGRQVESPTKGDRPWLQIEPRVLDGLRTAVVVDDFLAGGRTALALGEMLEEAGVRVLAFAFAVERAWAGGRERLEAGGHRVVAAAAVLAVEDGRPVLA